MKKIITICAAILMSASVFAQAPNKMSYQAVIRNNTNALVTNQAVGIRISILQTSPNGTAVYVETQTPTTNANGLASIEIGGGTIVSGNFTNLNWANGPYFVKTETDPNGGANYTITGTSQLLSVPYALYAENSGSSASGFTHFIGEEYGGGVIFHLWKDNSGIEHGLIVDKIDLSTSQNWSNIEQTYIGPSAQSSWNGLSNSIAIVAQAGHTSSASALCLNSNNGGQSDWYLPSFQELSMLWNNYYTIARSLTQISNATQLQPEPYWSSTELPVNQAAWYFSFRSGDAYDDYKGTAHYVRAVRSF
ncbi:MAG: DUF1566 domain-containing protein [Bacteroidota bacterium]|jgi:hypothetical protein